MQSALQQIRRVAPICVRLSILSLAPHTQTRDALVVFGLHSRTVANQGSGPEPSDAWAESTLLHWQQVLASVQSPAIDDREQVQRAGQRSDVKDLLHAAIRVRQGREAAVLPEQLVATLMQVYQHVLPGPEKVKFLQLMAREFGVQGGDVAAAVDNWRQAQAAGPSGIEESEARFLRTADRLQQACQPLYSSLFTPMSNQPGGIKFLVDLRADVLGAIKAQSARSAHMHAVSERIRRSLAAWFSSGLLQLERITWERSSAALLQKVMYYEAVHPISGWDALHLRLLPNRRVYAFFHPSLPGEPLVLLHTALMDRVARSMAEVLQQDASQQHAYERAAQHASTAVFYSVSSTQKGLAGVDLGNSLIKQVAHQLQRDFPHVTTLVTLSPMPKFSQWLATRLQKEEQENMESKGEARLLARKDEEALLQHALDTRKPSASTYGTAVAVLQDLLKQDTSIHNPQAEQVLRLVLMRLAAQYLLKERRRQLVLDPVANFHLRNGAVVHALHWQADMSAQGLKRSWGIMVSYKYNLEDVQRNNRAYLVDHVVQADAGVKALL